LQPRLDRPGLLVIRTEHERAVDLSTRDDRVPELQMKRGECAVNPAAVTVERVDQVVGSAHRLKRLIDEALLRT
jgi:hypothetical protein